MDNVLLPYSASDAGAKIKEVAKKDFGVTTAYQNHA